MATIYINPEVSGTGSGTLNDPYRSWASVTWTAGNSYLQKRGTSFAGQIAPSTSGTLGNPIEIGAYGDGARPIVGVGAQDGLYLAARQYINVADLELSGNTRHGAYIRTSGSNITTINVRRCVSRNNANNGFFLDGVVLTATLSNVLFEDCESYDNGEHGYDCLGIVQTVSWKRCIAARNGTRVLGHGFSIHPFLSNNITSGWTATGVGTSYSRTLSASETVQKAINRTDGVTLTKNVGAGTGVSANQWDQSGTTLYINVGTNPNGKTMAWKRATHGPFYYEDCVSYENSTAAGAGEGHGFAADDMTSDATYENCHGYDNEGAGLQCQWSDNVTHRNCSAVRNALSGFRTTGHTNGLVVDRCISASNVEHGFFYDQPHSGVQVRNSIAHRNGGYGLISSVAGVTAANNLTFGNASGATASVTNASGVTSDPLFVDPSKPWLGLKPGSPCQSAGAYIQGAKDRFGRRYLNPPNIGPWAILPRA